MNSKRKWLKVARRIAFMALGNMTLLLLVALPTAVQAEDFTYTISDGAVTITGYTGPGGDVSIPGTIDNLPVTSIGSSAFYYETSLTSVRIPSGITSIGSSAFQYCKGMTNITVVTANSAYSSLDGVLFNKYQTTLIQYPGGKTGAYSIPSYVFTIGDKAFYSCAGLTSVTIPSTVNEIGQWAFSGCKGLTSVTIPSSVDSIYRDAFKNCYGLVIAYFTGSAPYMGPYVFEYAASGFTVCYKSGSTGFISPTWKGYPAVSVGADSPVFTAAAKGITYGSATLNGVVNPNGLASTAQFEYGLTTAYGSTASVTLSPANGTTAQIVSKSISGLQAEQTYHYRLIATNSEGTSQGTDLTFTTAEFPYTYTTNDGAVTITGYTGSDGEVSIPGTIDDLPVTSIRDSAFANCYGLTSVSIPSSVTSIGSSAFSHCIYLTTLNIPNGVLNIGDFAFDACTRLTSVSIPASVTSIGDNVFDWCNALTAITVALGNPAYSSVDGVLFNQAKSTLIECPKGKTESYNIPSSVTSIESSAFSYCTGLPSVTIPSSVTSIGSSAFSGCTGLTSASFAGNAPAMGWSVFSDVASGFTVYYNYGSTGFISPIWNGYPAIMLGGAELPTVATFNASGTTTTSATLYGTVNPNDATTTAHFEYGLTTAYGSTVTVTLSPDDGSAEQTVSASITGLQSGQTYHYRLTATNNVGASSGVDMTFVAEAFPYTYTTSDGAVTITGCSYLGSEGDVNIPGTINGLPVAHIGMYAFSSKRLLTSVTIPDSVTNIGSYAFYNCISLTSVNLPDSVTDIGSRAFSHCGALTTITVDPGNLTFSSLDGVLFNQDKTTLIQCPGGKTGAYSIPASVASIGYNSFWDCTGLSSVTISGSVTNIGQEAFRNCTGLSNVIIPDSVTTIGSGAFAQCTRLANVDISSSVTYIWNSSFSGCSGLTNITVTAGNPNYSSADGVLFNLAKTTLILYPAGKTGVYSIPGSVTDIEYKAFESCLHLSAVNIPSSVTSIGGSAFRYCGGLTGASFAGNAPVMGSNVFADTASSFTVYYIDGSTGFTSPTWNGYPSVAVGAPPDVTTAAASGITTTAATLNGTVNPNGSTTTVQFEYGLTTAYGSTASVTLSPADGTTVQAVSKSISGLQAGHSYHYRLTALNSAGMGQGADLTLVAAPPGVADAIEQPGLTVTHGGTVPWFGQITTSYDGVDAARSGAITHNGESWMQTTLTGPGTLTYWWKVSSESGFDFLEFYLDGVLQPDRISGTVDWQQKAYSLSSGAHTVKWRYWKDGSISGGLDAGWVDQVSFVAGGSSPDVTTAAAGGITAISATLNGTVTPNGSTTTAQFEYGLTTAYGSIASVTLSPDNGSMEQTVSADLSVLQAGQTYHYRLVATNSAGSSVGDDMVFVMAGSSNIFEYAFGTNLSSGAMPLSLRMVNGRPVMEMLEQDAGTLSFVDLRVLGSTNLIDWTLLVAPAVDTNGLPENRMWFEPAGTPLDKAFFRLEAEWK